MATNEIQRIGEEERGKELCADQVRRQWEGGQWLSRLFDTNLIDNIQNCPRIVASKVASLV